MKNILIVYSKMVVGGSTTSLLSLLNKINYKKYQVDLLLYSNKGDLQKHIPQNVNVLSEVGPQVKHVKKYWRVGFWFNALKARYLSKRTKNRLINAQHLAKYEALATPRTIKQYDVAISFLEFWPMEYVAHKVEARKKLSWIHIDLKEGGLNPKVNRATYEKIDKIIMVSNSCRENLISLYPEISYKTVCVQNLLSSKTIRDISKSVEVATIKGKLKIVTVCRIVFSSKGIDRAVRVFGKLKREQLLSSDVYWYIIGDGPDKEKLIEIIKEEDLQQQIILLGQQLNPYAFEKEMDVFLLPSRFEGKPMAVTEAMMLGVVPFVCNYSSAKEQIEHGVDGIIVDNDDVALYFALKDLLQGKYNLQIMKENLLKRDYSNDEEIQKVYKLIEG